MLGVDSVVATLLVEQAGEGEETVGLADLARGVEQELLLPGNELADLLEVDADEKRQAVVVGAVDHVERAASRRP